MKLTKPHFHLKIIHPIRAR